jgi:hypothetical protein
MLVDARQIGTATVVLGRRPWHQAGEAGTACAASGWRQAPCPHSPILPGFLPLSGSWLLGVLGTRRPGRRVRRSTAPNPGQEAGCYDQRFPPEHPCGRSTQRSWACRRCRSNQDGGRGVRRRDRRGRLLWSGTARQKWRGPPCSGKSRVARPSLTWHQSDDGQSNSWGPRRRYGGRKRRPGCPTGCRKRTEPPGGWASASRHFGAAGGSGGCFVRGRR